MASPVSCSSRLLQVIHSRRAHLNCITMATWLQRTPARMQVGCSLHRSLNFSNFSHHYYASRNYFSQNLPNKLVHPVACQSNLFRLKSLGILCSANATTQRATSSILPVSAVGTSRQFHKQAALLAGHNKWSNIKHIKGAKDQERSLMIAKYTKLIKAAVKENGPNPATNTKLANVIQLASSKDMPKASIETAIKGANKVSLEIKQVYELKGPGGCSLIVDILTESANKTRQEMIKLLKNSGATIGDAGSIMYAFQRKGVVRVKPDSSGDQKPLTLDLATEIAIEVEAEDVQETVNDENEMVFMFICDTTDLNSVTKGLSSLSYSVDSSAFEYIPVPDYLVELSTPSLERVSKIIQSLEERPDVVKVYDNITVAD